MDLATHMDVPDILTDFNIVYNKIRFYWQHGISIVYRKRGFSFLVMYLWNYSCLSNPRRGGSRTKPPQNKLESRASVRKSYGGSDAEVSAVEVS